MIVLSITYNVCPIVTMNPFIKEGRRLYVEIGNESTFSEVEKNILFNIV